MATQYGKRMSKAYPAAWREITVRVHAEAGALWAEVVEMPGVFAAGDDLTELWLSLREGVGLYLSDGDGIVAVDFGEVQEVDDGPEPAPDPGVQTLRRELVTA